MVFLLPKNKARKLTCTEVFFRQDNYGKTLCEYHYDSYTDQERDLFRKNETSATFRNVSQKIAEQSVIPEILHPFHIIIQSFSLTRSNPQLPFVRKTLWLSYNHSFFDEKSGFVRNAQLF